MSEIDYDDVQVAINRKLSELENQENSELKTKIQIIRDIVELERILLDAGKLDISARYEFSSYITRKLNSRGIHPENWGNENYYNLFQEGEKRLQHGKTPTAIGGRNDTSHIQHDAIKDIQKILWGFEKPEDNEREQKFKDFVESIEIPQYETIKKIRSLVNKSLQSTDSIISRYQTSLYYQYEFENNFKTEQQARQMMTKLVKRDSLRVESIINKYQQHQQQQAVIESGINTSPTDILELEASILETAHRLDDRNKISTWEKITIILTSKTEAFNSHIAKLLEITKKHITNNIIPPENPVTHQENKHHKQISYFKAIEVISPSGEKFVFDITEWFEQQLIREKLALPFKPIILTNSQIVLEGATT